MRRNAAEVQKKQCYWRQTETPLPLVALTLSIHKGAMDQPALFDRHARRRARDRAAMSPEVERWLLLHMAHEMCDRLDDLMVKPKRALLVGLGAAVAITRELDRRGIGWLACDSSFRWARQFGGVQCDEDRLPFADSSFDLILSCGTLDSVNDLPGALVLMRRILAPGGVLIAMMTGGPSLAGLRSAFLDQAAQSGSPTAPHLHPQLDIRSMGDLLLRAGFTMPVVDQDRLERRYTDAKSLTAELQAMAMGNVMSGRRALRRSDWRAVSHVLEQSGSFTESWTVISLIAWVPSAGEGRQVGPRGKSFPAQG